MTDTEAETARKLAFIARLSAEELEGWVWAKEHYGRPYLDGERAALLSRAREIGVKIW